MLLVGLGALLGNLGGLAILEVTAEVLSRAGSYLPMFIYCACTYLLALLVVQLLVPGIESLPQPVAV